MQLGWTIAAGGDDRRAAETFLGLARDADAPDRQRSSSRYYAGVYFERAGDRELAFQQYRTVIDEFGESRDAETRRAFNKARAAMDRMAAEDK